MKKTIITDARYLTKYLRITELEVPKNTNYFLQINCNINLLYIYVPESSKITIRQQDGYRITFHDKKGEGILASEHLNLEFFTIESGFGDESTEPLGANEEFVLSN